ncbi:hypothetical protein DUNSADRAFT_6476 [Dunaliella salina]|uniref:Uncharacterized protein n=1 Tax=Dunaliella salina TaxID=3046 RepID=A0ABQ7GNC5_DUNSA|nr:hypothetical protein DUNSADRAFT_6476 [Dunaliella salina]|eukprot:KAF5836105.1 hypothetical protein DUNSADRAFT_6476 [Dunaliella salina]
METDSKEGTVSFKLREPGFLRIHEGTWSILPMGADALNPGNHGVLDAWSSTPGLINGSARRSSNGSGNSSSLSSSSTCHASTLERNLLAAMAFPQLNSPLMGTYKAQHSMLNLGGSMGASQLPLYQSSPSPGQVPNARSVVRVSNMMMSPKISPPFPLNHTLKSQAISQVQDMFDGLLAATLSLEAESNVDTAGTLLMAKP